MHVLADGIWDEHGTFQPLNRDKYTRFEWISEMLEMTFCLPDFARWICLIKQRSRFMPRFILAVWLVRVWHPVHTWWRVLYRDIMTYSVCYAPMTQEIPPTFKAEIDEFHIYSSCFSPDYSLFILRKPCGGRGSLRVNGLWHKARCR